MTDTAPVPVQPGAMVAAPGAVEGLEDFTAGDAVTPTITIDHDNALFVDSLSGETFPELDCVILGLIKQRVMWDPVLPDGGGKSVPFCKSNNFTVGLPGPKFPWNRQSVFEIPAVDQEGNYVVQPELSCDSCPFKEWETHPTRGKVPWCSELFTLGLLRPTPDGQSWSTALFTVQRSGLSNTKSYLTAFRNSGRPAYTVATKITLQGQKRGKTDYAVPVYLMGPEMPESNYPYLSGEYQELRKFVQNRGTVVAEDGDSDSNAAAVSDQAEAALAANAAPVQHPAQPVAQPVQPVAPVAPQQPVAQPVQQPVPQAAPMQQAPVAAPVEQAAPPVQPVAAEVAPPVQPAAAVVPPPAAPPVQQAADPGVPPAVAQVFPGAEPVAPQPAAVPAAAPADYDDDVPF